MQTLYQSKETNRFLVLSLPNAALKKVYSCNLCLFVKLQKSGSTEYLRIWYQPGDFIMLGFQTAHIGLGCQPMVSTCLRILYSVLKTLIWFLGETHGDVYRPL